MWVCFLHGLRVVRHRNTGTTFDIRHEECPRLIDAIAPLRDIVAVEATRRLLSSVLLHELALATHALFLILPGVIEVRQVDTDTEDGSCSSHAGGFPEAFHPVLADSHDEPGDNHEEDDEQIIIGHLHMVGLDLKSREDSRHDEAPQVFAAVGKDETTDHWREVS